MKKVWSWVISPLRKCDLCEEHCKKYIMLCNDCFDDCIKFNLDRIDYDLLNWPEINKLLSPTSFDQLISIAPYEWPYSHWIHQLKYQGHFETATLLSQLMTQIWQSSPAKDSCKNIAVMAVPLNIKKWQERGYNQAHLIAKQFTQKNQIQDLSHLLVRNKRTVDQVGLTGKERRKNLKKAFNLKSVSLLPKHIILIDDVVTTGSTANEISLLLKKSGVEKVTLFTICLALPN